MKGKKVLVVGLGRSGKAACDVLLHMGAKVTVQDANIKDNIAEDTIEYLEGNDIKYYFGEDPETIEGFDYIVVSPGVPLRIPFIQAAIAEKVPVIGELELAYRIGKGKTIAITGTNGKTTTTTLVGEIIKAAGKKCEVVGNIGEPAVKAAVSVDDETFLVTEVSSFQLETIVEYKPEISAILNLAPDHLDRHGSYQNYISAKARIFENQTKDDVLVLNFDDKQTFNLASASKAMIVPFSRFEQLPLGAYVKEGVICFKNFDEKEIQLCKAEELLIPGAHNLENALAAVAITCVAGIEADTISEVLRTFKGVEHRIELCAVIKGVSYINDSKGTNPDAAIKAIRAIKGDKVLIMGGYDKGIEFTDLVKEFDDSIKMVLLLGATASKIKACASEAGFDRTIIMSDMKACVEEAARIACNGCSVLLSPACASWDMYDNYEQRGRDFKDCVMELEK